MKQSYLNWKHIFGIIGLTSGLAMITIFLLFFQGSFDLMESWMIRELMNAMQDKGKVISLYWYTGLFILLEAVFGAILGLMIGKIVIYGKRKLQLSLAQHLLQCSYESFVEKGTGEWQTRVNAESQYSVEGVKYFFQTVIHGLIFLIGPLMIAFAVCWQMAILALIMVPLVIFGAAKFSAPIGKETENVQNENAKANQIYQEYIWQIPINKAYSVQEEWNQYIGRTLEHMYKVQRNFLKAQMILEPFINIVQLAPQIIMMSVGGILLLNEMITVGDLMLFIIFFGYIANGLMGIPNWIAELRKYTGYQKRVNEILSLPTGDGEEEIFASEHGIKFKNVGFSYASNKFSLKDITLEIEEGAHIAVVGESGCGKSTLLKLIVGLYRPIEGEAVVWDCDLHNCSNTQLFSHFAVLLQDTYLFPGTIRENLTIGCKDKINDEIEEVCKKASLWEWISELPNGLETEISEFAGNISGGQKQRIGIARAMLRKADIWLVDEPTSALDNRTALEVHKNLRKITRECTTITITHQLFEMEYYDQVLFMEDGRILAQGTHEELINTNNAYRNFMKQKSVAV